MLLSTPDLNEALAWALAYWLQEGNDALAALSISDERAAWVLSGELLRQVLHERLYGAPVSWSTSATEDLTDGEWLALAS